MSHEYLREPISGEDFKKMSSTPEGKKELEATDMDPDSPNFGRTTKEFAEKVAAKYYAPGKPYNDGPGHTGQHNIDHDEYYTLEEESVPFSPPADATNGERQDQDLIRQRARWGHLAKKSMIDQVKAAKASGDEAELERLRKILKDPEDKE